MIKMKAGMLVSLVGSAAFAAAPAISQQMPGAVPGSQTDTVVPKPQAKPAPDGMIQVAPAEQQVPKASESGATVVVSQFKFTGNASEPSEVLAPLVAGSVGKSLTLDQLLEAADAVRAHYHRKGWFLARAYVPAQPVKDGVVEIAVLEGRVDQVTVKVAPDAPVGAAYATSLAENFLKPGMPIVDAAIEKPLLLLRDLPRVEATSVIDPGRELGTASITVNVQADKEAHLVTGKVELDNNGSNGSGRNRLGAEVSVGSPMGIGDLLSLRAFITNESGNAFGRASYSLPVGPWGTRVGVNAGRLNYELGDIGVFSVLEPHGVAEIYSASAAHPLIRSRYNNLYAELVLERKNLRERFKLTNSDDKFAVSAARLQLSGDMQDQYAGVTLYSLALTSGKLSINNAVKRANDQDPVSGAHTEGSFAKLLYSVQRLQQLTSGLHLLGSLSGQLTNKNLYSAERFTLGGEGTVRAYPVGEVVGDEGYAATLEARYTIPQSWAKDLNMVATLFYDYGHSTFNHDNNLLKVVDNRRSISGWGVGMNFGYAQHFLLNVAVAWRANGVSVLESRSGPRVLARASYSF